MKESGEPPHSSTTSVPAALLDYFGAPGKYQLTLRQPAVLFASVREILQLASDRGGADAPQSGRLREAAHFFIRAALLYPGGDHYAVLGLAAGETATDLKERYRLLMRLIHPDFAGAGAAWPADAAVRVNRAYEVLSSPVLRREYDEQLAASRSPRAGPAKAPAFRPPAVRRGEETKGRMGRKAAVLFGLAVGIPAVLLLLPRTEPDHLVQRLPAPERTQRALRGDPEPAATASPAMATLPAAAETASTPPAPPAPAVTPAVAVAVPEPARPAAAAMQDTSTRAARATATPAVQEAAVATRLPPLEASPPPRPAVAVAVRAAAPALPPAPPAPPAPSAPLAPPAVRLMEPPRRPEPAPVPAARVVEEQAVAATAPTMGVPAPALPPPDPAPTAERVSSSPATRAAVVLTAVSPPAPLAPTLADAQPLLTQVLQVLETGSGEQLLRLLDGEARKRPGAQALSRQYEQLVKGGRPVRLSQVDFQGEPKDGGVLLVTGRIRLHAGEPTIGSFGQKLVVRAEFAQRAGKVQLTGLSGATE